eukprot:3544696-Rhodomonas_salina.2
MYAMIALAVSRTTMIMTDASLHASDLVVSRYELWLRFVKGHGWTHASSNPASSPGTTTALISIDG